MGAYVFDLDETLIDRNRAVECFAAKFWTDCFSTEVLAMQDFMDRVKTLDQNGYRSRVEFFDLMNNQFADWIPTRGKVEEAFYTEVWETPLLAVSNQLDIDPGASWFVGDHPVNDIWGSKQVGFLTAWVHLGRPWWMDHLPCYDVRGENFAETMSLVLETA